MRSAARRRSRTNAQAFEQIHSGTPSRTGELARRHTLGLTPLAGPARERRRTERTRSTPVVALHNTDEANVIGPAEIDDMLAEYAQRIKGGDDATQSPVWPVLRDHVHPAPGDYVTASGRFWSECFGWAEAPGRSVLG
jgi:hypothetical protein